MSERKPGWAMPPLPPEAPPDAVPTVVWAAGWALIWESETSEGDLEGSEWWPFIGAEASALDLIGAGYSPRGRPWWRRAHRGTPKLTPSLEPIGGSAWDALVAARASGDAEAIERAATFYLRSLGPNAALEVTDD